MRKYVLIVTIFARYIILWIWVLFIFNFLYKRPPSQLYSFKTRIKASRLYWETTPRPSVWTPWNLWKGLRNSRNIFTKAIKFSKVNPIWLLFFGFLEKRLGCCWNAAISQGFGTPQCFFARVGPPPMYPLQIHICKNTVFIFCAVRDRRMPPVGQPTYQPTHPMGEGPYTEVEMQMLARRFRANMDFDNTGAVITSITEKNHRVRDAAIAIKVLLDLGGKHLWVFFFFCNTELFARWKKTFRKQKTPLKTKNTPGGTRTRNPCLRRAMPYPLGHRSCSGIVGMVPLKVWNVSRKFSCGLYTQNSKSEWTQMLHQLRKEVNFWW